MRNQGNLVHQSPRGNMDKLFDCIKTPLKRFLACLTFHRKEIRLYHLHKRTNPGCASEHEFSCGNIFGGRLLMN